MIVPIKRLKDLSSDEEITDRLFDELRYGDTVPALWVNRFGSAEALRAACAAYKGRPAKVTENYHTAWRMYASEVKNKARKRKSLEFKKLKQEKKEVTELEWARSVARAVSKQQDTINLGRNNKRKYL